MKKVFDKRNLKLLERLLENQGVSLKEESTLNEVSLSKRLSSFKQAVVGSTGEDAWKDAWDIASSGMSDPEAEKQLYDNMLSNETADHYAAINQSLLRDGIWN